MKTNKVIINSAVLLYALEYVKKVMVKNPVVPITENYLLSVSGGKMKVSGTDLQSTLSMTIQVEANEGTEFKACLSPESLKYLKKLDKDQAITLESIVTAVTIGDEENVSYAVIIHDESGRAKYAGENTEDFPMAPKVETDSILLPVTALSELKDLLNYVIEDELRPAMTGVYFGHHEGMFNMVATDGHGIKVVNIPELDELHKIAGTDKHLFIIPGKVCKLLSDSKPDTNYSVNVKVKHNDAVINPSIINACFLFDDAKTGNSIELICKVIDELYPQYWHVIPGSELTLTKYTIDRKPFLKQLDKAEMFANRTTHQVKISLNGSNKIQAEDLDFSNEYSGDIGGTYDGNPLEIGFNSKFLRRLVSSFEGNPVIEMREANRAGVIRQGNSIALCVCL